MANLGKIKELAREKNITLGALANMIDITEQGLHRLIRDNSTKVETLEKIAKALNCSILVFFDGEQGVNVTGNTAANINAAGRDINTDESIKQAFEEIAAQRKLTENAQNITQEAQRQSADLINIVKNLTNK